MNKNSSSQWIVYVAAIASVGYAAYKYLVHDRKTPRQLKEEGTVCYAEKRFGEALEKYQEALKMLRAQNSPPELELAVKLYNNLSQTMFALKNYPGALEYAEQTLQLNPQHLNSFKRLAKLEKIGRGYGGDKGLAVLTAYLILLKEVGGGAPGAVDPSGTAGDGQEPSWEEWRQVLSLKISEQAKQRAQALAPSDSLQVPLVKLEEILLTFQGILRDGAFGEVTAADEAMLACISNRHYAELLQQLSAAKQAGELSKRSLFLIGNIRFVQKRLQEAVRYLDRAGTRYSDVLSIYMQKLHHPGASIPEDKLGRVLAKNQDPIIGVYLAQVQLAMNNVGYYLAKMVELENEQSSPLPFIANAKSQFEMGEYQEVAKTLRRALALFPEDISVVCTGVELLSQLKDHAEASFLQELLEQLEQPAVSNSPRCAFFRYVGYSSLEETQRAASALEAAIALDPYNASLLMQQGYELIHRHEAAGLALMEQAAALAPESAEETFKQMLTYKSMCLVQELFPKVAELALPLPEKERE